MSNAANADIAGLIENHLGLMAKKFAEQMQHAEDRYNDWHNAPKDAKPSHIPPTRYEQRAIRESRQIAIDTFIWYHVNVMQEGGETPSDEIADCAEYLLAYFKAEYLRWKDEFTIQSAERRAS